MNTSQKNNQAINQQFQQPQTWNNQQQNFGQRNNFNQRQNGSLPRSNSNSSNGSVNNYNSPLYKSARINFIRKVYSILLGQLIFTTLMVYYAMEVPAFSQFQSQFPGLMLFFLFVAFFIAIIFACFKSVAQSVPINYILLIIFTFCEGYFVSYLCSIYDDMIVFQAATLTAGVTLGLTIYAFTTDRDFTTMGALLFVMLFALIFLGILSLLIQSPVLRLVYLFFGVIVYGLYLIFDTQLIIGNMGYKLDIDDYIFGAMSLYIDIIQIFLKLLQILGGSPKQD